FYGRFFSNITNNKSPVWLQKQLKALGVKSISAIVDIGNYFTFVYGRPVHFFDATNLEKLVISQGKDSDKFLALNDKEYQLN
ncbi:phenylalanine--tRNA ligase beta subunit-related protein, partial [Salmonella enterica]|uniref:phenylalanine--tRNA ligase beta subunit-related protein n=1 Tax=Salmonella enterica TaxID=28901 RepID=UPI00329835C8